MTKYRIEAHGIRGFGTWYAIYKKKFFFWTRQAAYIDTYEEAAKIVEKLESQDSRKRGEQNGVLR